MPSFDAVCSPDMPEVKNAVTNTERNLGLRFDFKGTSAAIEFDGETITLIGDSDFQLAQIEDVLRHKMSKRGVDARFLTMGEIEKMGGNRVRQAVTLRRGISRDDARDIQKLIKDSKLKVRAAIQGDSVRVTGNKKDDLQAAIALLRKEMTELPLSFENFRA